MSRQIVQIQYSHSTVITVKILNPLDSDLVLHAGDEVAVVRIEKDASPGDPMCKTYSQIKEEALNSAKESVATSMSEAQKHAIVKEVVEDLVSPSQSANHLIMQIDKVKLDCEYQQENHSLVLMGDFI